MQAVSRIIRIEKRFKKNLMNFTICRLIPKVFPLFIFFIFSNTVFAQTDLLSSPDLTQVRIESYSNEQLLDFYNNAAHAGYTPEEIYNIAIAKGLPLTELNLLKKRLSLLVIKEPTNLNKKGFYDTNLYDKRFDSNLGKIPVTSKVVDYTIFGSELFASNSLVFEPNLRIPAPPNYRLGPDDEIVISVFGYSEKKYALKVNELGEIYIPNVGPIQVNGLTLEQATDKIKNKLGSTIYTAIRTGQTKVQVTLGQIRSIRVTVIGQAKKPGTYTVSSLTTLYNILYLCGGPTNMGSFRDIEIIRGNEKRSADLYDFLVYGNQKDNILLQEGDVIRIPYYENRVTLEGNVKREGKYEMLKNETFKNLLEYSGGFTDNAYRGAVTVERITDSVRKIIDLPSTDFNSFKIKGSDKYFVGNLQEEFGNRLYISGSVQRPGPYELTDGMTVADLIHKAGGLKVDAYTNRALIYRYLPNQLPAIEAVNIDSILNNNLAVYLQKNDSLVINSIFYFKDNQTVTVQGSVRNPRQFDWRKNLTLRDILLASGGINESGDSATIEISRRIQNANVENADHVESKIFVIDLTSQNAEDMFLKPYDIVIVKEKPGYTIQRTVLVRGEVLSPGTYALANSGSKISDVINRTGGFKASADSNSITIRRLRNGSLTNEERQQIFQRILNINSDSLSKNITLQNELYKPYDIIAINLKQALQNNNSSENLQLEDGDILTIERATNLVKVGGEVYFPTVVAYQPNKNLKYYVQQAGNFMPHARKTGALVIHPNGKVASVKHFLFFKFYPEVTPRSEIFVPKKEKDNRTKITTAEWALIVSALGIVANVILNTK